MPSWGPDDRPKMLPEAAFRRYEGEAVVVLPAGAEIKVLNPSGSLIFELLDGTHTVDQIVEAIEREYEVGGEEARSDLMSFLEELADHGMLAGTEG